MYAYQTLNALKLEQNSQAAVWTSKTDIMNTLKKCDKNEHLSTRS